jgi:hypothetical protein
VWSQVFEHALEDRLVSRQACCPIGLGFGHEPVARLVRIRATDPVSRAVTPGHCLLPHQVA